MSPSATEIVARVARLRQALSDNGLDAAFIIQNVDLYYFSGTLQQGALFVHRDADPILFVRRDADRARRESPIADICRIKSYRDMATQIAGRGMAFSRAGLEMDVLPVLHYRRIADAFPGVVFDDISLVARRLRMTKSAYEITCIEKAGLLVADVFDAVKPMIREGVSELDIAYEIEYAARRRGHMGLVRTRSFNMEMFYGHFLSGESGLTLSYVDSPTAGEGPGRFFPQGAGLKRLRRGEVFSIDFVFVSDGYMVDQTRNYHLGEPPGTVRNAHAAARAIHEAVRERAKPGVRCADMVALCAEIAETRGLARVFMGPEGKQASYMGHGVGLELDELPLISAGSDDVIDENTVFALEPKFFLPDAGMVGIENTYLMTAEGLLLLTKYPEDIQIIV